MTNPHDNPDELAKIQELVSGLVYADYIDERHGAMLFEAATKLLSMVDTRDQRIAELEAKLRAGMDMAWPESLEELKGEGNE